MKSHGVIAVACLVAGVPLAAYGLTYGSLLAIVAGLALVLVFVYLAWAWIAGAGKPMGAEGQIKPSADAAWKLKDEPARGTSQSNPNDGR